MGETVSKIDGYWKTTFGWGITKTAHPGHFQSTQCSLTGGEKNRAKSGKRCCLPVLWFSSGIEVYSVTFRKDTAKASTGRVCEWWLNRTESWSENQQAAFRGRCPPRAWNQLPVSVLDSRHGASAFRKQCPPWSLAEDQITEGTQGSKEYLTWAALSTHPSIFAHSHFSHFYSCLFQNCRDLRSYFLVGLFLLSSSPLLVNYVCDSLSLNPPAFVDLCLKYRDPEWKWHCRSKLRAHRGPFPFALVRWDLFVHSPSDPCVSAPISSRWCLYDKVSTASKPAWSLLLCFPLTMCVSACLSPDVFVSIFPVESHPAISCSYC